MTAGRPRQFDRKEVLHKAMDLFWTQGYQATGLTDLLDHLGIARQSLYRTFGDKRSLYIEALREFGDQNLSFFQSALSGVSGAEARLKVLFSLWHQKIETTTDSCGCLLGNTVIEFGESDPEVAAIAAEFLGKLEDLLTVELEAAKQEGVITNEANPPALAHWLISNIQGLALLSRTEQSSERLHGLLHTTWEMLMKS